jgi:hypothetical protein
MPMEILNVEQGGPEWHQARLGIPTASMFSAVIAKGEGKTRRAYMIKLAGERLTQIPMESYSNDDMERGTMQEPEIRTRYEFMTNSTVQRIGFVRNGRRGCSPDGFVGDDGMVEIKSAAPHVLIDILLAGVPPKKHLPQCMGGLWLTGRKWCDLVIGSSPKLPLFTWRHFRDESYIKMLEAEVDYFNGELVHMVRQIEGM